MRHIHLIGIGGTGISSIARVLLEKGYTVSGSDRVLSNLALELQKSGVKVFEGHNAENIKGADVVVRSSAIPNDNPEVIAAINSGIPVLKRSDFLGSLMEQNKGIAVAGSHGKTTTSAMMAWTLARIGLDPSYILGGVSRNLSGNAHAGAGEYFVIEADEYDRMFLGLNPSVILITNVEYDHPDCYPTPESYLSVFNEFVTQLKHGGLLVTNGDQARSKGLTASLPYLAQAVTYGLSESTDYQAVNLMLNDYGGTTFNVRTGGKTVPLAPVQLQVPGEHNVRNALGVLAVVHKLGLAVDKAAEALSEFKGTGRRFEIVGEINEITIIDDYAHHPTKIKATLAAARQRFPGRRVVAVWQPHTYSRTHALENEFIDSLKNADVAIVTEVYASREKIEPYSAEQLVVKMHRKTAHFVSTLDQAVDKLMSILKPGDVLLVLSAGDADLICDKVIAQLNERIL